MLKSTLCIRSTPELERLITESIYSKIIDAKLYNQEEFVRIYSSIGRDVLLNHEPDKKYGTNKRISDLIGGLQAFGARVEKGQQYINEVRSSVVTDDAANSPSKEDTPTPMTTSEASASDSLDSGEQFLDQVALVNNKRKRKIEGK